MPGDRRVRLPTIAFEVTTRCSLDCGYCYNVWKRPGERPPFDGSYAQATRTLRRLFRQAEVAHLTLTGGEPLLAPRVAEVVLEARLRGAQVTVISNGQAEPDAYQPLLDLGVHLFELPLHSPGPGAHDALTGVRGSWERSLRALRGLLARGGRVAAVVVVTRPNHALVGETLALLGREGVRRVMVNRFNVGGRGIRERARLAPPAAELDVAFRQAARAAREHGLQVSSNIGLPPCVLDPAAYPELRFTICPADPAQMPLTLDLLGNLRACNHSPVVLGNIFESNVGDLLASAAARQWRETVPERCAGCPHWSRCRGGCRAAAQQTGGTLADPDPVAAR